MIEEIEEVEVIEMAAKNLQENQIKENQIKENQIKENQIKENQIKENKTLPFCFAHINFRTLFLVSYIWIIHFFFIVRV